jgi:hypothetical protein
MRTDGSKLCQNEKAIIIGVSSGFDFFACPQPGPAGTKKVIKKSGRKFFPGDIVY